MADALVLAAKKRPDAIVDIATLTGACMRELGTRIAGVMGNSKPLIDQVLRSAEATQEQAWQLPLEHAYRRELDSDVADLTNVGGPNAGAITAVLFLEEFAAPAVGASGHRGRRAGGAAGVVADKRLQRIRRPAARRPRRRLPVGLTAT